MKTLVITAVAVLGLAGCADFGPSDIVAGSELDGNGFGDATAINMSEQRRRNASNERPLNGKFAQAVFNGMITSAAPAAAVSETTVGGE